MISSTTFTFTSLLALAASASASIVPTTLPSAFNGPQSGIGSWYQANSARDYTNGHSWCGYTYTDSDPLFAPSLKLMGGATYSSDPNAWREQTAKYCGLEAKVTDPDTGKTSLLYIGDSFAQPRSDGAIDIMLGGFEGLNGDPKQDKNVVIKAVKWELTGNVNTQYMAPSAKKPSGAVAQAGGNGTPTTLVKVTKTKAAGN